jgi:hypothetical protein
VRRVRRFFAALGVAAAAVWVLGFGLFGLAVLLVAPPVGLVALGLASLPLWSAFFHVVGASAAPGARAPMTLDATLLTAVDLAAPMAGPGSRGPWMPVDPSTGTPPLILPVDTDGSAVGWVAEVGVVLAGGLPSQAVRHAVCVYPVGVDVLSGERGNDLGVFGVPVAAFDRLPDGDGVGEAHLRVRVLAADGTASRAVLWRRGPVLAQVVVSGDEQLAEILLGHAVAVADQRLAWAIAAAG